MSKTEDLRTGLDIAKTKTNEAWAGVKDAIPPRRILEHMLGMMLTDVKKFPSDQLAGLLDDVQAPTKSASGGVAEAAGLLGRMLASEDRYPAPQTVQKAHMAAHLLGAQNTPHNRATLATPVPELAAKLGEDFAAIRGLAQQLTDRIEGALATTKGLGNTLFEVTGEAGERHSEACLIEVTGSSGPGLLPNVADGIAIIEERL